MTWIPSVHPGSTNIGLGIGAQTDPAKARSARRQNRNRRTWRCHPSGRRLCATGNRPICRASRVVPLHPQRD
ncbi:MAG: hypothetical protein MZV64_02720 [Ignavibacteriales bacterium]|nr:hypothetical protein [Ignavibacteriales bacterium]